MNEETELYYLCVPGWGKAFFGERNQREVDCKRCGQALPPDRGMRFRSERYSTNKSGFLCTGCLEKILGNHKSWHFNPFMGILFPARSFTTKRMQGKELAQVYRLNGLDGLQVALAARQEQSTTAAD